MKRIYLLVVALFFYGFANAQIVNIPDANFKARLVNSSSTNYVAKNLSGNYFKIDSNNNQEIELTEAFEVSDLFLVSLSISNLTGISDFNNLVKLNCQSNSLTTISLNSNLNLIDLDCSNNQITLINTNTNLIKLNCSNNQLTSINLNNNVNLQDLVCNNNQLSILNIDNNINLKTLSCTYNQLTSLNTNSNASIKYVYCEFNQLTSINLNSNCCLEYLYCNNNLLTSLNVSNYTNLRFLNCKQNQISSLDVSNNLGLFSLNCSNNGLFSINVDNNIILHKFNCSQNQLTSLSISNNIYLTTLQCNNNQLTTINFINNAELEFLYCQQNQFTALDLINNFYINVLNCDNNQITNLNLTQNLYLRQLDCSQNQLIELNLSKNKYLNYLNCSSNPLVTLFIKNNASEISKDINNVDLPLFNFSNLPTLRYICGDDFQIQSIQDQVIVYGYTNCNVNSYCSFTPGGTFYTIQGNQKFDTNNNGCDAFDNPYQNLKYSVTDGTSSGNLIFDTSGNYIITVKEGSYTITPVLENPTYFIISPTNVVVTFPTQTSPYIQNFCVTSNGLHPDLEVNILPIEDALPGFDAKYKLIYKNKGNTLQSGNVNLSFNDSVLDLVSALPTVTTQTLNNLSWVFTNLQPFESREITFTLNVNSPMEIPAVNDGDILNYVATITSAAIDEMPNDNTFAYNQTVVNSFDPNDKTCLEGATISQTKVGDYVHYMIRFENNGTANAQNIVVKDMIDTTKFDVNSIVPIKGSHSFVTNISVGNKVEFIFENIQLPFDDARANA